MGTLKNRVINFDFKDWLRRNWKVLIFLVLLVSIAYGNCLNSDFVSDDTRSILRNPELDKASHIFQGSTGYLRLTFIYIINKIFGRNPLFFRLINILFHLGVVLTVYLLIDFLSGPKAALICAAILAVHPIQSESVSWISGGVYTQYSFFLILSLLTYILSSRSKKLFIISITSFILGLLSSLQSIVFPLIVLLFVISFDSFRRSWKKLLVFFAVDGIWAFFCLFKITGRITELQTSFYHKPQMFNPLIQIPVAITSYLELIFWPKGLTLYHSEMIFSQTEYIIRLLIFILFLAAIVYSYRRSRLVFFWSSFFVVSLLPTLTPFGISWIVAERYVYLGAIGIFAIIALWIKRLWEIRRLRVVTGLLFCSIIIALLARTIMRNIDWRNEDNLWIATAKTSPSSPNTHNNLGDVYSRHGDLEKAASEFKLAIKIKPYYADAYHNLAHTYQKMGRLPEAVENYQKAIHFNSELWQSYQNLAGIYFIEQKFELAKDNLEMAVKINPKSSALHSSLGTVYFVTGDKKRARVEFQEALGLNPSDTMAKRRLNLLSQP